MLDPLKKAIVLNDFDMFNNILHNDVSLVDFNINDALYFATKTNKLEFVSLLLADTRLNQWTDNLASILMAISIANEDILRLLINQLNYNHNYNEKLIIGLRREIATCSINSPNTIKTLLSQIVL